MPTPSMAAPRIQVFRPTMEEFKDFSKYIQYIESQGAHKAGLAKIIPPEGWVPRKNGYDDIDLVIPSPIIQYIRGRQGLYQQFNVSQKRLSVKEYRKLAESKRFKTPNHFDYEDLERRYWKNITFNSPIYGADVSGSLYDDGVKEFNIQSLNTILDLVKENYEIQIEGVNTAYLYFGMWKTTFAWHTEDMDLYSINYVHFGAPKSWYVVPPEHGRRLERLATGFFPSSFSECSAFLRHKMTIISPHVLKKYSIPYSKITQEPGEFMITFPFAYHSGFNHGFNIAESTNFALPRWIEYGKRSTSCVCRNDCVKICMDIFVRKFQPERYELWKQGKDLGSHPEDPTGRQYPAPAPKKLDLAICAQRERKKKAQKIKRHPIFKSKNISNTVNMGHSNYKSHLMDSDEETKLYDVNEIVNGEFSKKEQKKGTKRKRTPSKNGEKKKRVSTTKKKIRMTVSTTQNISIDIQMPVENNETEIKNESDCEAKASDSRELETMEEEFKDVSSNSLLIQDIRTKKVVNKSPLELKPVTDNPPELQPFWDPGVKAEKVKSENIEETKQAFNSKMRLLEYYPNLHKAVNAGAFSVVAINSESPSENSFDKCKNEIKLENNDELKAESSELQYQNFNQIWRCEGNGLKIKVVKEPNYPSSFLSPEKNFSKMYSPSDNKIDSSDLSVLTTETIQFPSPSSSMQGNSSGVLTMETPQFSSPLSSVQGNSGVLDVLTMKTPQFSSPLSSVQGNSSDFGVLTMETPQFSSPLSSVQIKDSDVNKKKVDNLDIEWAKPLENLWQHQPHSFQAEIDYNQKLACITPHCAICAIFSPIHNMNNFPSEPSHVPSYSSVKMPAYCYGNSSKSEFMVDANSLIRMDGTAPILTCSVCKITVHAPCYGVSMLPCPLNSWTCTRCSQKSFEADCCLCPLRGGALKPTTDGRWAHIICAILISETYFESNVQKQPIDVSNITPNRHRLKCRYCFKTCLSKESKGICIQCRSGKCHLPFHVTCGFMAGVIYETCDWPEPIHVICIRHVAARRKPPKRKLTNISRGEKVIAQHKNKRYYWANVTTKYVQEYYSILFDDNSHSTNTMPEDIVQRSTTAFGTPEINEKVRVKWSDGKIYNGIFKGSQSCELYVIEFDDGFTRNLERKEIYAADEELPKKIRSKVSHSSERFNISFETETYGKRVRISNHKYS